MRRSKTTSVVPPVAPAPPPTGTWTDVPLTSSYWTGMWDYTISGGVITLNPPYVAGGTRSGLVVSKLNYVYPRMRVTYTYTQNRPTPNAWECFWMLPFFIDLSTAAGFDKQMNSIVPKSDGHLMLECASALIAEQWPEPAVEPSISCAPGVQHVLEGQINQQTVTVILDGSTKLNAWVNTNTAQFYTASGAKMGLYSEDAVVTITRVEVLTA